MTLSNTARRVHEQYLSLQMSALFLSAGGELPDTPEGRKAFEGVMTVAFAQATRIASAYDQMVQKHPMTKPAPPPPAPSVPQPGTNADGTPFVWERPSKDLVEALRHLRGLAEEPPKTVQEIADKIAPIQQFLKAYDEAQPRV